MNGRIDHDDTAVAVAGRYREVAALFLKLGVMAFGGPAAIATTRGMIVA